MIRIGVFARLGEVSLKTLRHYDDVGLLTPALVDHESGYRYYALEQLPRLHRILALKDLGFSLGEIAGLLRRGLPPEAVRRLLRDKEAEMRRRLAEDQARLARVQTRLRQLEQEETMSDFDVRLKPLAPQIVASVRETIPDWEQVTPTFNRIFDEAYAYVLGHGGQPAGPPLDRWLDTGQMLLQDHRPEGDLHVEACVPLRGAIPESGRVRVYEMEGADAAASAVLHGPFTGIGRAHEAVIRWAEANGYRISGPSREVYLQYRRDGDPQDYVTEVQYPVAPA